MVALTVLDSQLHISRLCLEELVPEFDSTLAEIFREGVL